MMTRFEWRGYKVLNHKNTWRALGIEIGYGIGGVWKLMIGLWTHTVLLHWAFVRDQDYNIHELDEAWRNG